MNYPLHEDLKMLEKQKMPANPKLLPLMNVAMNIFSCKSDDKVTVTSHTISGYQGAEISLFVIEPKGIQKKLPCLVFFHGGGFILKASGSHYQIAKEYASKTPCKVVYADYRLAPKHAFPIPVEDCYAAYRWTLEQAENLNIDTDKIIIGGDSAGGNLAAAVTLMARDRGLKMPVYELLIYPVTDRRMGTKSMREYTDTPVWDARLSKMMWDCYLGKQTPKPVAYASPMETDSLDGFPPVYIEVAEFDCLRDEGIAFAEKLRMADIPVELHEIKGACHGFETAVESSITRACMKRRVECLKKI